MATRHGTARRATTYERVSLDRRDVRRSVTEQRDDNMGTVEREAWAYVDDGRPFVDNDRSASRYAKKTRPGYVRLVEFVTAGFCDVVVVWELSRLSRDLGALVAFRDLCRDRGVLWSIGGRTYDPSDERDTLPLIVQACQAEGESANTSKRVRRGMNANAAAGRPHGRLTYGYRREYDPTTKAFIRQVVDDDQATILHEISDRFLTGEAFYSIARDLTGRGVPSPAGGVKWHPTNCARLMRNRAYVAQRVQNGDVVADAVWPAIFDGTTWAELQGKLDDPTRRTRKEPAIRYLLTGFAT
ncbi:MAG: recombinase family protein, partial [Jatrophihabitantaceae bacterium]